MHSLDTLLKSGLILPMRPLRQRIYGDILIRDGRILALGPKLDEQAQKPCRVVDLNGAWVLPAFIQSQVVLRDGLLLSGFDPQKIAMAGGSKKGALKKAEYLRSLARLGMARLLLSGTTCALDAGLDKQVDSFFEAASDLGGRLFSGLVIASNQVNRPLSGRGSVQASLAESEKLRKLWDGADNGHMRTVYLPGDIRQCDEDLLVELAGRARAASSLVHCRLGNRQDVSASLLRMNSAGLTGPDVVMALGPKLCARDHKLLRDSQSPVSHSPLTDLRSGAGLAKLGEWIKHGVHLSYGSGSLAKSGSHQVIEALHSMSLVYRHRGSTAPLDAWELLRLATLNAAEALGIDKDLGSIEPGKKADLIVIKPNMLRQDTGGDNPAETIVMAASSADIQHVFVDGDFVVRDRRLVHFDQERIEREVLRLLATVSKFGKER